MGRKSNVQLVRKQEEKQEAPALPGMELAAYPEQGPRTEKMYDAELTLTLKQEGGKGDKLVLLSTKARGTLIQSILEYAVTQDRRNKAMIQAVLDNPSEEEMREIEAARKASGASDAVEEEL